MCERRLVILVATKTRKRGPVSSAKVDVGFVVTGNMASWSCAERTELPALERESSTVVYVIDTAEAFQDNM
jgi:hypothetical protein